MVGETEKEKVPSGFNVPATIFTVFVNESTHEHADAATPAGTGVVNSKESPAKNFTGGCWVLGMAISDGIPSNSHATDQDVEEPAH